MNVRNVYVREMFSSKFDTSAGTAFRLSKASHKLRFVKGM
jgi:hypothetical protein